ncbi:MAG: DUF4367 domain-containing protein [Candidatus Eremiobacteraeota bacterium]|nr:DUF4367 domain-containing protein [Candidatus Eremiobacteraeota bacterium]
MPRRSVFAALALSLVGVPASAPAGVPAVNESPAALLSQVIAAPAVLSYSGTVEAVRIGNQRSEASVYRVEHRAPNLTRRNYSAPAALMGEAMVSKGDVVDAIDPRRHRIVETRNGALDDRVAYDDSYTLLLQNYRLIAEPDETYDSRSVAVISLINKYTARQTMLLRIDRQTKIVLDRQEFGTDGSFVSEMRFERFEATAPPASDFTLPKGYQVVQGPTYAQHSSDPQLAARSAGFAAVEPKGLAEGFAPVEATMVELRGVRTLHVLYCDGIRTVSLFENADATALDTTGLTAEATSVGSRSAQYAEDGATALLAWNDATLHYALVGELTENELRRIAASISR